MSDPVAVAVPASQPSFWEDVLEIFFHPVAVFRRRQHSSVWPPMLFVAIAIGVISFATFNQLSPIFDAEFTRNATRTMAKNPQITQEMMDRMHDTGMKLARFTLPVILLVSLFVLGIVTWLVSLLVGAKTTFQQGIVVAAWSYFPRVLGAVINGVQGLLMDPAKLNSQLSISLSPARFMDADAANPLLYQLAGRFDLITIWVTVLLAIGIYVTGRISRERAIVFGVLIWIVGALPALRTAYTLM